MIRLLGCARKFDTFIPEKNHKSKVKEHAWRMQYQSVDFGYWTATKDYDDCVLHVAECEVFSTEPETVIHKFIGIYKETIEDFETKSKRM